MYPYCVSLHSPFNSSPPGPAPPTPTGYLSSSLSFSTSSNSSQDVHLESSASMPFSVNHRSPSICSPLRGRNLKDHLQQLEQLKKDNFDLKLRIYFLEERLSHKNKGDKDGVYNANIEIKVENEALKKELCDKQDLIRQAAALMTNLEEQFKEQQDFTEQTHQQETEELNEKIKNLQMELNELKKVKEDGLADLTQLCDLAFGCEKSGFASASNLNCEENLVSGPNGASLVSNEVPEIAKIKIKELEVEVEKLANYIHSLEEDIQEKNRFSEALQEDIVNLNKELEDREEKIVELEQEVVEKDQKVDHLMQDLETRHLEIEAKESTIHNLNEDLNKVGPQIEVKVQEMREKDRIIEEKSDQIQLQNKILVEIQITLDEKQKQISDLEEALVAANEETHNIDKELNSSLYTIKTMTEDMLSRDKQITLLRKDLKKEERKVKVLLAEHKEVLDMLKKEKWKAEVGGGHDDIREMAEDENERLWAELEQRKFEITKLQNLNVKALKEAKEREEDLISRKNEAENQLSSLQKQLEEITKNGSSSDTNQSSLLEKLELKDKELKSQTSMIDFLQSELKTAKTELNDRMEELKRLKLRFTDAVFDPTTVLSKELDDRNKMIKDLFNKLFERSNSNKENTLSLVKQLIESYQSDKYQHQPKSSSLSNLEAQSVISKTDENEEIPRSSAKCGRSNSFSLLENALYAHMGQKMVNTNQTFNTYVISSKNPNEQTSETENGKVKEFHDMEAPYENYTQDRLPFTSKTDVDKTIGLKQHIDKDLKVDSVVGSNDKGSSSPCLKEEILIFKNEVDTLKNDRLRLDKEIDSFRALVQSKFTMDSKDNVHDNSVSENGVANMINQKSFSVECPKHITKNIFPCPFVNEYQTVLKKYKTELISLRKRLTESNNSCDLLRNRLEELVEFFERILDMEKRGYIDLSYLSNYDRSVLQKSLDDSRALSITLSQSLMIGMDSALNGALVNEDQTIIDQTIHNSSFINASLFENEENLDLVCSCSTFYSTLIKCSDELQSKIEILSNFTNKLVQLDSVRGNKNEINPLFIHQTDSHKMDNFCQTSLIVDSEMPHISTTLPKAMSYTLPSCSEHQSNFEVVSGDKVDNGQMNLSVKAHQENSLQENMFTGIDFNSKFVVGNLVPDYVPTRPSISSNIHDALSESEVWIQPDFPSVRSGFDASNTSAVSHSRISDRSDSLLSMGDEHSKLELKSVSPSYNYGLKMNKTQPDTLEVKRLQSKVKNLERVNLNEQLVDCVKALEGKDITEIEEMLKNCEQNLPVSRDLELKLKKQLKESESKVCELTSRLSDYMVCNQNLERKVADQVTELQANKQRFKYMEHELQQHISNSYRSDVNCRKSEFSDQNQITLLHKQVNEKTLEIEKQRHLILSLERAKEDSKLKLQDQNTALTNLCRRFNILTNEAIKSSTFDNLITEINEILLNSESRLLQAAKEKFALINDKTLLQSQLNSLKMENEILKSSASDIVNSELNSAREFINSLELKLGLSQENSHVDSKDTTHSLDERIATIKDRMFIPNFEELLDLKKAFEQFKYKYSLLQREKDALISQGQQNEEKIKELSEQDLEISHLKKEFLILQTFNKQLQSLLNSEKSRVQTLETQIKTLSLGTCKCNETVLSTNHVDNSTTGGGFSSARSSISALSSPSKQIRFSEADDKENVQPGRQPLSENGSSFTGDSPDLGIEVSGESCLEFHKSRSGDNVKAKDNLLNREFQRKNNNQRCFEPDHNTLLMDTERLRRENETMSSKIIKIETELSEAQNQLSTAAKKKEAVDRAICRQLTKTHRVLKQTKGNLRFSRQATQGNVDSTPASLPSSSK